MLRDINLNTGMDDKIMFYLISLIDGLSFCCLLRNFNNVSSVICLHEEFGALLCRQLSVWLLNFQLTVCMGCLAIDLCVGSFGLIDGLSVSCLFDRFDSWLITISHRSVAEPVHFWPAPAPSIFFTGSGSSSYKKVGF